MGILIRHFTFDTEKVCLPYWLDKLENKAKEDISGHPKLIDLKFTDFLGSLGDEMEDMRSVCANIGEVSRAQPEPLSIALLEQWILGWVL